MVLLCAQCGAAWLHRHSRSNHERLNWCNPSLITAMRRKPLTALRSLFILFCRSAHQRGRADMSVMAHRNGGTLMTACVVSPDPPTNPPNSREEQQGEKKTKKQKTALGTSLYHKKLKAFHPSWPISRGKYARGKWRLSGHCSKSSVQQSSNRDQHLVRSATVKTDLLLGRKSAYVGHL